MHVHHMAIMHVQEEPPKKKKDVKAKVHPLKPVM
jgi:hypothetical protein